MARVRARVILGLARVRARVILVARARAGIF